MIEACINCKYATKTSRPNVSPDDFIECRRYPPQRTSVQYPQGGLINVNHYDFHPFVPPTGWCGEFKEKPGNG